MTSASETSLPPRVCDGKTKYHQQVSSTVDELIR